MKKKSMIRKILSLICCVTLCLTTFAPIVANAAPLTGSPSATMNMPKNDKLYDASWYPISEGTVDVKEDLYESNYAPYRYTCENNAITVIALDENTLWNKTIVFYAEAENKPTVKEVTGASACQTNVDSFEDSPGLWKITVKFTTTSRNGSYTLAYEEGVEQYDVTFAPGEDTFNTDYSVYVDGEENPVSGTSVSCSKGEHKFEIAPKSGKQISSVVAGRNNVLKADEKGFYTYDVQAKTTITITVQDKTYKVARPAKSDNYKYEIDIESNENAVPYNGNFKFQIIPQNGYASVESVTYTYVDAEGKTQTGYPQNSGNTYLITGIKQDITAINVTMGSLASYSVRYPSSSKYFTISAKEGDTLPSTVAHGGTIEFIVKPTTGYEISDVTADMGDDAANVSYDKNTYVCTISGVTGAVKNITVTTEVATRTITVTNKAETEATVYAATTVEYGKDYTFRVVPKSGYDAPIVKNGDTVLEPEGNTYTVYHVTENLVITIEAKGLKQYNVTYPHDDNYTVTSGEKATHNQVHTFTVKPAIGYEISRVTATVNGSTTPLTATKTDENGVSYYETAAVTTDVTIAVTVRKMRYTVTVVNNDSDMVVTDAMTTDDVEHGSAFKFAVTAATGYGTPSVKTEPADALTSLGNGQFSVKVTGPVTITITAGKANDYSVIYNPGTGYTFGTTPATVEYTKDLTFAVTANPGYDIEKVSATMGGTDVSVVKNENGSYTVKGVTANVSISVSVKLINYDVKFDDKSEGSANLPTAGDTVTVGSRYSFAVTAKPGFTAPIVEVNGNVLTIDATENRYIVNVTADMISNEKLTITVKPGTAITYKATYLNGEGFTAEGAEKIGHGAPYNGSITVLPQYNQSTPVVTANGNQVNVVRGDTAEDGSVTYTYTIENVTANQQIAVTGLVKNTYTVTLVPGEGYTLTALNVLTVTAGEDFHFQWSKNDGYDATNANVVVTGGEATLDNGVYTIAKVSANIRISVSGVTPITYTATIVANANATVTFTTDNANNIAHNGTYGFSVTANPGYRVVSVLVNGLSVSAASGNNYTVGDVNQNQKIEVTTVANKLTVTYISSETNHTSSDKVEYTYDQLMGAQLKALSGCEIHKFDGWYDGDVKVESLDRYTLDLANGDYAVNLTAKFELDITGLLNVGQTVKTVKKTGEASYMVTFTTSIGSAFKNAESACIRDLVTITAYGTLLSRGNGIDFKAVENHLATRTGSGATYKSEMINLVSGEQVLNTYADCNFTWSEFFAQDTHIIQRTSGLKTENNDRNAAGWIELTIDGVRYQIIAQASGTDAAQS